MSHRSSQVCTRWDDDEDDDFSIGEYLKEHGERPKQNDPTVDTTYMATEIITLGSHEDSTSEDKYEESISISTPLTIAPPPGPNPSIPLTTIAAANGSAVTIPNRRPSTYQDWVQLKLWLGYPIDGHFVWPSRLRHQIQSPGTEAGDGSSSASENIGGGFSSSDSKTSGSTRASSPTSEEIVEATKEEPAGSIRPKHPRYNHTITGLATASKWAYSNPAAFRITRCRQKNHEIYSKSVILKALESSRR
ncbi:uncharacterized protein BDR25DRAFT_311867 [Lindgomyces ingoldianus]|uniref:Uncharacterized protein n=1 Tax=Lindgomyces ingoldianus TaxID=673940 RepID=A0ACB6R3I0_9PLEO|nr:uncharacterized protein BDR25DRAFT_311867 [Lindgomyces ingoldianus]KAF2473655.1 hypothetical protein BDR25DRAFT_311867 [Lindgomyces ingoldianus]